MIFSSQEKRWMQRAIHLAQLGSGSVSPNPQVGAVLVHNNRIIGEGYHEYFGGPHAEVNAVSSVQTEDLHLISQSTLFVTLEPCCFYGKTPACTDLILRNKIPKVIIGCQDPGDKVNGKGIALLKAHGIEVKTGLLEEQARQLIRPYQINTTEKRPYTILKYAQSKNGYIGVKNQFFWITSPISKRLVHKWRSEVDAILIGSNTARIDNPQLTNRYFFGKSPVRIVIDRQRSLPQNLAIFQGTTKTIIVTEKEQAKASPTHVTFLKISFDQYFIETLSETLLSHFNIGILLVEGGAITLQHWLDSGHWDEARIFTGAREIHKDGIIAPVLYGKKQSSSKIGMDLLDIYNR